MGRMNECLYRVRRKKRREKRRELRLMAVHYATGI